LDLTSCLLSIFIATSNGTSDFFADCLERWWEANQGIRTSLGYLGDFGMTGR
jgi:hypothetical protein